MYGLQHITAHFNHGDKVPMHTTPGDYFKFSNANSTTTEHKFFSHIVQWRFNIMTGTQIDASDPVLCMNDEKQTLIRFQSERMYANTHTQVHTRRAYVHKHIQNVLSWLYTQANNEFSFTP